MSGKTTERTTFGDGTGSDGRALTDTDLNNISNNMTRRAWEVPGYADLLAFDQSGNLGLTYSATFTAAGGDTAGRANGVFTRGGGLTPIVSGLEVLVGSGMLGVWNQDTPAPPAQNGVATMAWMWCEGTDGLYCDSEATGYKRWDLFYCTVAEADAPTVARHFEDAVTGAKSTQNVVPAKLMSVSFALVKGTASNAGAETVPSIPSHARVLYAMHVDGDGGGAGVTAITEVLDFTIPAAPLQKALQPGGAGMFTTAGWQVSGASGQITSQNTGTQNFAYFFPPGLSSNGEHRALRLRLSHKLATGSTCELGRYDATLGWTQLTDLSGSLVPDGSDKVMSVDLRGFPENSAGGAYWGGGKRYKEQIAASAGLGLRVRGPAADGGGSRIYSVEWFFV